MPFTHAQSKERQTILFRFNLTALLLIILTAMLIKSDLFISKKLSYRLSLVGFMAMMPGVSCCYYGAAIVITVTPLLLWRAHCFYY